MLVLSIGTFLLLMSASFAGGALSLLAWQRKRSRSAAKQQ